MKQVVMIGPAPEARGGMASVVHTYLANGYCADGRCLFIATHVDGTRARKAARALAALLQFGVLLARGRVALLHVHVASGTSFWRKALFIGAARLFRRPVLLHLHGGAFRQFVDVGLAGWRQRLALRTLGAASAAFALTEEAAAWLRARARIARVEVFPNPVRVPPRPAPRASERARVVLFLGRIEAQKGVFDLIQAFSRVHAAMPGAQLVLGGEGDRAGAAALAARLGLAGQVLLPGWLEGPARAEILNTAAVFVLPSHQEQMPMAILEAMSFGIPVVATKVGAVQLMLLQGKCGFLVHVGNIQELAAGILRILEDNILADKISECGLERVRSEFMVEAVLTRLRRRYEELAA